MGEIRTVRPGKTRGYPYLVCKNNNSDTEVLSSFLWGLLLKIDG